MLHGATDVFRQEFQVLMKRSRYLWLLTVSAFSWKPGLPRGLWPLKRIQATGLTSLKNGNILSAFQTNSPAIFNPTPVPPNLEDVSKPLVPKDSLFHAFLACLHFCYGSDHILSSLLFHTIGNRRLWSWLCIPHLISKSSLLLSSLTLIASHQSLTLAVSLVLVISWNHSPLYTCTAASESRPPLGLAFIMTTILSVFLTQAVPIHSSFCSQRAFSKMPIYLNISFPCLKLLVFFHCPDIKSKLLTMAYKFLPASLPSHSCIIHSRDT